MNNLDFKNILLLVLVITCVGLTLGIIFKPNNIINYNEDVIRALKEENIRLLIKNDSIKVNNDKLSYEIDSLGQIIDDMNEDLNDTKENILENLSIEIYKKHKNGTETMFGESAII